MVETSLRRAAVHLGLYLLALVALLALVGCKDPTTLEGQRKSLIPLKSCTLSPPGQPMFLAARCGTYEVPEDWQKPKGRKITLRLAVVPATFSKKKKADPLFFFTGGPGQAATESYPSVARGFAKINRYRDIVLIDQRGTGGSHKVACPRDPALNQLAEPKPAQIAAYLKKCVAAFKGGLQHYTTTASIQDFNAVRKALGYDKINIYGISYGTRVAQTYMRRYKEHVRSVILDGVVPQDMLLGWDTSVYAPDRVKKWLLARCRADRNCHKAFPNLAKSLAAIEKRIKAEQPLLSMRHPRTYKTIKSRASWSVWGLGFRLFGYSSLQVAVLPLLLHESHKKKDIRPVVKWALSQVMDLHTVISSLENSVLCAEDWPFMGKYRTLKKSPTGYGFNRFQSMATLCKVWPNVPVKPDFKKLVVSAIPTLVLSGQYDPVTPPAFGKRVADKLSNSLHVVVPGEGHGVIGFGCMPKLAKQFIDGASVKKLDATCIKTHKTLGFFIDFAGPELAR